MVHVAEVTCSRTTFLITFITGHVLQSQGGGDGEVLGDGEVSGGEEVSCGLEVIMLVKDVSYGTRQKVGDGDGDGVIVTFGH